MQIKSLLGITKTKRIDNIQKDKKDKRYKQGKDKDTEQYLSKDKSFKDYIDFYKRGN